MVQEPTNYGASATEAWAEQDHFDPDTHVSIPSEDAVERAKNWVEENEL